MAALVTCSTHGGHVVELFCRDCERLLCLKCAAYDHKTHTFVPLADETSSSEHRVLAAAVPAALELASVTDARDRCKTLLTELGVQAKAALAQTKAMFVAIRRAAVAREAVVEGELKAEEVRKRDLLLAHIETFEGQRDCTEEGLALVKRTLDGADAVSLLGVRHTLITGLEGLYRHGLDLTPPCDSDLVVRKTGELDAALQFIAAVATVTGAP
jgi:hypothetical protein